MQGFERAGSFRLPSRVWEESCSGIVKVKSGDLRKKFKDDDAALMVIEGLKKRPKSLANTRMNMGIPIM